MHVVGPAGGEQGADERQAQVRGHLGHGVAHLAVGPERKGRVQGDAADEEAEQGTGGLRQAKGMKEGGDEPLQGRGRGQGDARSRTGAGDGQAKQGQEHAQTEPLGHAGEQQGGKRHHALARIGREEGV